MKQFYVQCILAILFISQTKISAQDSIRLTLQESETLFFQENLMLMAERLELDINDLKIREARRWKNPEFEIEHQIINREGSGPIGFTATDNIAFGFEQLIQTAGKRGHQIKLRELERLQAEQQLDILIRTFIRTLREEYFKLALLNQIEGLYQTQIQALENMLVVFEEQFERGNIPRLEVIRLRTALLEIQAEYHEILNEQFASLQSLQILLQLNDRIPVPELPEEFENPLENIEELNLNELYASAIAQRGDVQTAFTSLKIAERTLFLERANRWPDIGVGIVYDRLDGVIDNYFGLTLNFELPVWNRNRENVKIAMTQIRQNELLLDYKKTGLMYEIQRVVSRLERAERLFERIDAAHEQDAANIIEMITEQYRRGDIGLLEFLDFYTSFREGVKRNHSIKSDFLNAIEELNFVIGEDIIELNF